MSANLRWGLADPERFVALLRQHRVDVVGLQELGHDQADAIAEELPFGLMSPAEGPGGTGLALRRPAKVDAIAMNFRPLHVAMLEPGEWPGLHGPVEIAATHFAAPHVKPYGSGFWHRYRQLRDIEGYLVSNPLDRRVLVGDFNATPVWPAYRRIASHLTDAAVEVAQLQGRPLRKTWGPLLDSAHWLRIDHAFVRGLRSLDFEVVGIEGSDHGAIIVDFSCEP